MSRKNDISSSLCNGLHKKNRNSTQEPYAGDKQWDIVLKDENNNNTPPHNRKRCSIKSPWTQAIPNQQHTRVVVYISYQQQQNPCHSSSKRSSHQDIATTTQCDQLAAMTLIKFIATSIYIQSTPEQQTHIQNLHLIYASPHYTINQHKTHKQQQQYLNQMFPLPLEIVATSSEENMVATNTR